MSDEIVQELRGIREALEAIAGKKRAEGLPQQAYKDVREWNELRARALNSVLLKDEEVAKKKRDEICDKYHLSVADVVALSEGKPIRREEDE